MSQGLARVGVMRSFAAHLGRYPGVSAEALLRDAGFDPARFEDADAIHAVRRNIELLERAAQATRDPAFAIGWSEKLPWADLGVLGYVVLHAPTIGAAFGNAARYLAVQQTTGELRLTSEGKLATLAYLVRDPDITRHGQQSEASFALLVRACREGTGRPGWAPREVRFRHKAPRSAAAHRRYFRAPVEFGCDEDALIVTADDLRAPFVRADPGLLPILVEHAEACLARMPRTADFPAQVRRIIADAITGGDVAIEGIAARLDLSARTLQRQLREHACSFKALVDDTRLALARRYLDDPALSLTEAAYLLGYADLSAFSRAFRRWTGESPQAARSRATPRRG